MLKHRELCEAASAILHGTEEQLIAATDGLLRKANAACFVAEAPGDDEVQDEGVLFFLMAQRTLRVLKSFGAEARHDLSDLIAKCERIRESIIACGGYPEVLVTR